jgi:hypothetical protein
MKRFVDSHPTLSISGQAAQGLVALGLSVGVGLLAVLLSAALSGNSKFALILGVVGVLIAATPTIARLRNHALDAAGLYALATAAELGLVSLAWLGSPVSPGPGLGREQITAALVLVILGIAAFGIGAHLLGLAKPVRLLRLPQAASASLGALSVAYFVSLAGVFLGLALGVLGYIANAGATAHLLAFGQTFNLLAILGNLVVLATALTYFASGNTNLRTLLVLSVGIQVTVGFVIGFKATALEPLVYTALAYLVTQGRLPWRFAFAVVAVTVVLLVPLNLAYRGTLRNTSGVSTGTALSSSVGTLSHTSVFDALESSYAEFLHRYRLIDSIALIETLTPKPRPYGSGTDYLLLPAVILVPRALWPGKPQQTEGGEFSHTYWNIPAAIRTATPITMIGDLYRNFSSIGVAAGMTLWGVLLAGWTALYRRYQSPRWHFVYIVSATLAFTAVEGIIPSVCSTGAKTLGFAALVAWFLLPGTNSQPGYRQLFRPVG